MYTTYRYHRGDEGVAGDAQEKEQSGGGRFDWLAIHRYVRGVWFCMSCVS
jgi:hypothetical protein